MQGRLRRQQRRFRRRSPSDSRAPRCGYRNVINTLTTATTGLPPLTMPRGPVDGLPVGLSILARPGADAMLLALARNLANCS
jgi:Asp-tRNA(Asn)/Glu-tRNA(Gln) amidotransferase A subunit family amidase